MNDPRQEFDEELQFHIEQRIHEYIARGMTPEAARAAVTERLGDLADVRRECTSTLAAQRAAEERRGMIRMSWLDVKLGLRMFARYPGLSLVSVIAMAVAIAIAAGYFAVFGVLFDSTLPFDQAGRMVVIRTRVLAGQPGLGAGASMHDFEAWRSQVTSITDIGAFREDSRNLIVASTPTSSAAPGTRTYLVTVATLTASAFPLTGTGPLLGRTLLPEDERPDAPPVLVIGQEEWQRRFNGDPNILGRTVRIDDTHHTVVGVMPRGFGFPINHSYWVPLRPADFDRSPAAGTSVNVFGRLADGLTLQDARTELAMIGERMAAALPGTHQGVGPQVQSYTHTFTGSEGPEAELAARSLQFGVTLLLLLIAVNVSILVYARTATRTGEIAVRTALGASRPRVVAQLFVEALVPALIAAAAGLGLVGVAFRLLRGYIRTSSDRVFYWITPESFSVSPGTILYSLALATVAAAIIGVLPALKATGRRVQRGLQQFSARGAGLQLGGTWTALIVLQVAVAVGALPAALFHAEGGIRLGMTRPAPAAAPLLRATLSDGAISGSDPQASQRAAVFTARMTAFIARLEAEPGVSAVTYAFRFPGEEPSLSYEVEADSQPVPVGFRVGINRVAPSLFEVLEVPVLAGRGFTNADTAPGAGGVIVDQAFADRLGGHVLGRRIRPSIPSRDGGTRPGLWHEIVGVVPAFADRLAPPVGIGVPSPRVYHAAMPGDNIPATVIIQGSGGDPLRLAERLRGISASVHPTLKVESLVGVVHEFDQARRFFWYMAAGVLAVTASVLLLSAAGIYAMMSFTVARRRREIGIRTALGADARRVLMGIFGRAAAQIGAGVALGLTLAAVLEFGGVTSGSGFARLPVVAAIMFAVGVLAAIGPARRGLAVQPTEALREE